VNQKDAEANLSEGDCGMLAHARRAIPGAEVSVVDGKLIITGKFERRDGRRREPMSPQPKPAKVAQLLALAHRVEAAVRTGKFRSHALVARAFGMSKSRMGQIVGLTFLAPDIQEALLNRESVNGVEPITERELRPIAEEQDWGKQREKWAGLSSHTR
jgi:hypothetical protein